MGAAHSAPPASSQPVLVFAAASLTNALDQLSADYQATSGQRVTLSYASSATLARQIAAGANAAVFISADEEWMNYLQSRALIASSSRVNLLGNTLVLIAPASSAVQLSIHSHFDLLAALGTGRLALADPESVPAGRYARAALSTLGVWDTVAGRLVTADSVRTALAFVAQGEAPVGVVYRTDALVEPRVRILDTFPAGTHAPIVYPAALCVGASATAGQFLAYLQGTNARRVFQRYGFEMPEPSQVTAP